MKYTQLVKSINSANQQLLGRVATVANQALVVRNWLIGAYIVEFEQRGEDRAKYGDRLYVRLASDLREKKINGCGERMLQQMAVFYRAYPQVGQAIPQPLVAELVVPLFPKPIVGFLIGGRQAVSKPVTNSATTGCGISQTVSGQSPCVTPLSPATVLHFSWSHLLELIRIDAPLKRAFYENECLKGNWSKRQLQRQIGSLLYERTGLSRDKTAVIRRAHRQERQETITDLIRDPYVLVFSGLAELPHYNESDLEKALLDHLQQFLLELGTGFCFEARQFRVTIGNEHDYVDLVFYHRVLRCRVILDLKLRAFKHADAGQMNYYLNYFKKCVMHEGDQPPVGILLCSDRESAKVEFAVSGMDNKLFVSRYMVALPSPEELQRFLEKDREQIESLMKRTNQVSNKPGRAAKKGAARDSVSGTEKVRTALVATGNLNDNRLKSNAKTSKSKP